ncbi:MAG: ATP-binding cassette domain-containing protein [Rhodoferax sp.]|jgi:oligopeptide/dipeptide ABC transporter ATP-binding protein|nr:ATP-binding cassette domain-containing protein [Rhodoferax sp.]
MPPDATTSPHATTPAPLLRVRDLSKHYLLPGNKQFKALNAVSFDLQDGRTLGIVGESGCGKSTLARTLMRLVDATGGTVEFGGVSWIAPGAQPDREHRRWMQMVFQDPFSSLNPKHSIGEVVREPLDIHWTTKTRAERMQRVRELLTTVGLTATDADKYPHEFSGGQRQRIAIARALALEPRLLVADEPVSALDVSIQSQILNLLIELRRQHRMAMLFISHDLSVVRHISDDVAVMYFGNIVEMAPARDVFEQPAHPYTRLLLSSIPSRNKTAGAAHLAADHEVAGSELPDPANPPRGCAFAPRCPRAMASCQQSIPALVPRAVPEPQRVVLVACHLYDAQVTA